MFDKGRPGAALGDLDSLQMPLFHGEKMASSLRSPW